MGLRNYVLKNNEKPATHIIVAWKNVYGTTSWHNSDPIDIRHQWLYVYDCDIALFKIRWK